MTGKMVHCFDSLLRNGNGCTRRNS